MDALVIQLGEMDGPKPQKWTVQKHESGRFTKNGTGWYSKCQGSSEGVKVDGSHKMKLEGTQKCVSGRKGVKVDGPHKMKVNGPKMRGRSKKGESGRSQNV